MDMFGNLSITYIKLTMWSLLKMFIDNWTDILRILAFSILFVLVLLTLTRFLFRYKLFTNLKKHIAFLLLSIILSMWAILPFIKTANTLWSEIWYFELGFWLFFLLTVGLGIYLFNYEYLKITNELNKQIRSVTEEYVATVENIEDVVISLARTIDAKDKYTEGHTERVSQYATFLAERLGLNDKQLEKIRIGALIHDIGKIAINLNILNKSEMLTEEEKFQIALHPELGEQICSPLNAMSEIRTIIRHHHEKLDGSGYPDGLKGDEISIEVRIVAIADIFDALTTDRAYRKALDANHALDIIKAEALEGKLDQVIVAEFEEMLIELGVLN